MLLKTFYRSKDKHDVVGLGIRRVLCARAHHINDAFLETDDLPGCHNGSTFQNEGFAFANGVYIADKSGENFIGTLKKFASGLDNILHWKNADALARHGKIDIHLNKAFVTGKLGYELFFIDIKNAVFNSRLVTPRKFIDFYVMEF
jgi:hypothetical protein